VGKIKKSGLPFVLIFIVIFLLSILPQSGSVPFISDIQSDSVLNAQPNNGSTSTMANDIIEDLPVTLDLSFSKVPTITQEGLLSANITPLVDIQEVTVQLLLPDEIHSLASINWTGNLISNVSRQFTYSLIASKPGDYYIQVFAEASSLDGSLKVFSQSMFLSISANRTIYSEDSSKLGMNEVGATESAENAPFQINPFVNSPGGLTVYGYWYYNDQNSITNKPIRYARVELWDGDFPLDVRLATTYTQSNGYYQFTTIDNNDGLFEGGYDIYVKVFCDSDLEACVADSSGSTYYSQTPKTDNVADGSYNIGGYAVIGNSRGCYGILDSIIQEYWWLYNKVGWSRSEVQVRWPSGTWPCSDGNTIYLPMSANELECAWDYSTIYHEYAHCIQYAARSGSFPSGGGGSHYIDSETNSGFALIEGWAEFMQCAVANEPYSNLFGSLESYQYADGIFGHGDNGDWDGNIVEGAVASVFWDIFDGPSSSDHPYYSQVGDYIDNDFSKLWAIFLNNDPDSIDQIWGAWTPQNSNSWAIFYNSRINKDTTAPTGSIIISAGATYTQTSTVTLALGYFDALSGVYQIRLSNDGIWDSEIWESPTASKTWTLNSGDGAKTVYYQAKDYADQTSATYVDGVVLDTTNPSIPNPDDNVPSWSSINTRTFTWLSSSDATSGVAGYYWRIDSSAETWITTTSTSINPQTDGSHTFYVRAKDNAGNLGSYGIHIFQIDTAAPTGSITISNGNTYTTSTSVILTLTSADTTSGVYQARYSNDGIWDTELWENPTSTRAWMLTSGDGIKTVYYQVKDNTALVSSPLSDTIILDTTNPSTPSPDDGVSGWNTATSRTFSWSLSTDVSSGIAGYYWKVDGGTETWITSTSVTIPSQTEGTHIFYTRASDNAGNVGEYGTHLFQIDFTAPSGSISINQNATYSTSTTVLLSLTYSDTFSGVNKARFSNDGVWDSEPWESPVQTKTWDLTNGDGLKTVYFQIRDNAGVLSDTISCTIVYDSIPPTGSIAIDSGATYAISPSVILSLTYCDANGISTVHFSNDGVSWINWESPSSSKAWTLTSGDGAKTVYYQIKDNAGLVSAYQDSIVLDTIPPVANAGQTQTVTLGTTVFLDGGASSDASNIESYTWTFGDGHQSIGQTTSHQYSNVGAYTVTLTVQDPAGNIASTTVTVNVEAQSTTTPTPIATPSGNTPASNPTTNPTAQPTTNPTSNPTKTPNSQPSSSPTPTITTKPNLTTIQTITDKGETITLILNGNITSQQISNVKMTTNQTSAQTTLSFAVTGPSGSSGFGNVTIPKNSVPNGAFPQIFVDNLLCQNQGYCQDDDNYYVWWTTHFSTHQISVVFNGTTLPSDVSLSIWLLIPIILLVVIAVIVTVIFLERRKR
jgi:hypothetical protein